MNLVVIPARLKSTRLSHKALADINGQSLIYHVWQNAKRAKLVNEIIVATDSKLISDVVIKFGGVAVMTPASCPSGTDRVAAAVKKLKKTNLDLVINLQGDEPLMPSEAIDLLIQKMKRMPAMVMGTVATPFSHQESANPNVVKVVVDKGGRALYFSRATIPYPRHENKFYLKHIGLYAFRPDFLEKFVSLSQTSLEKTESLEQLRALENGFGICVAVGDFFTKSVDTIEDLDEVRKIFKDRNIC